MWQGLGKGLGPRMRSPLPGRVEPQVEPAQRPNGEQVKKLLALLTDKDFELPEAPLPAPSRARRGAAELPGGTRARRRSVDAVPDRGAAVVAAKGDVDGAVRVLSSIIEEHPARGDALRLVGYRLLDLKQPVQAARLFQQVQQQRPFEPHSYRDLARAPGAKRPLWPGRGALRDRPGRHVARPVRQRSLKEVAQEEYAHMMRQAAAARAA